MPHSRELIVYVQALRKEIIYIHALCKENVLAHALQKEGEIFLQHKRLSLRPNLSSVSYCFTQRRRFTDQILANNKRLRRNQG